jgi:HlyD family secretion protein
VTPKIAGRIVAIHAKEGDRVDAGRVIVELAHDELDRQVDAIAETIRAAEAMAGAAREQEAAVRVQADTARRNADRAEKLAASGSISAQALDLATAQRDALAAQLAGVRFQAGAAEAQHAQARAQSQVVAAQIANATLAAPIAGIVFTRNLEIGENAFPGSSVMTLVDDRDLWVKVYVSESMLGRVKIGMAAAVTVDSFPGRTFSGTVTYVSPQAEFTPKNVQTKEERVRLVYAVKVKVDSADGALKIGMPADVALVEK